MYILPVLIIALCKYTSIAVDDGTEVPDSISNTAEYNVNDQGKLVMSSFVNRQGIRIRTYASRVKNPKGHVILIHGARSHFRDEFCRYNIEWYGQNVGEYIDPDAQTILDKELKDIFCDSKSYDAYHTPYEDPLHGKNALDLTPRFLYKGTFVDSLSKLGFSVYGFDLQSHGLSGGVNKVRCYIEDYNVFSYDLMQFVSIVKRGTFDNKLEVWDEQKVYSDDRHDNLPYHLIGLSMGSNVVLRAQLLFHMEDKGIGKFADSIICLSSLFFYGGYSRCVSRLLRPIIKFYSIIKPTRGVMFEDVSGYEQGMDYCMRYHDPLHHSHRLPSRTVLCMYDEIQDLSRKMHQYPKDLPTLFIHSKDDPLCSVEGPREYMNNYFKDNKFVKLVELEGKMHVITTPVYSLKIMPILKQWFNITDDN